MSVWSIVGSITLTIDQPTSSVAGGFPRRVFLVGAPLGPRQVDAEGFGGAEGVFVEFADLDLFARFVHDADVEAERLHLLDQHLEALRNARLGDVLALDDGLV